MLPQSKKLKNGIDKTRFMPYNNNEIKGGRGFLLSRLFMRARKGKVKK
jgi:hypothetical protein